LIASRIKRDSQPNRQSAAKETQAMSTRPSRKPIEILLVEDNPGDVRLTREAFADATVRQNLSVVGDGEEAMAFLRRQGDYATAPRPDLILLDLNLPRKSGREVLAELKHDSGLLSVPVVVMTASEAEVDIVNSYHLNANTYVTKPVDLDCFVDIVNSYHLNANTYVTKPVDLDCFVDVVSKIEGFWLTIVKLPPD
jgi:chemotaxis family two-component system response regulator Rcp1